MADLFPDQDIFLDASVEGRRAAFRVLDDALVALVIQAAESFEATSRAFDAVTAGDYKGQTGEAGFPIEMYEASHVVRDAAMLAHRFGLLANEIGASGSSLYIPSPMLQHAYDVLVNYGESAQVNTGNGTVDAMLDEVRPLNLLSSHAEFSLFRVVERIGPRARRASFRVTERAPLLADAFGLAVEAADAEVATASAVEATRDYLGARSTVAELSALSTEANRRLHEGLSQIYYAGLRVARVEVAARVAAPLLSQGSTFAERVTVGLEMFRTIEEFPNLRRLILIVDRNTPRWQRGLVTSELRRAFEGNIPQLAFQPADPSAARQHSRRLWVQWGRSGTQLQKGLVDMLARAIDPVNSNDVVIRDLRGYSTTELIALANIDPANYQEAVDVIWYLGGPFAEPRYPAGITPHGYAMAEIDAGMPLDEAIELLRDRLNLSEELNAALHAALSRIVPESILVTIGHVLALPTVAVERLEALGPHRLELDRLFEVFGLPLYELELDTTAAFEPAAPDRSAAEGGSALRGFAAQTLGDLRDSDARLLQRRAFLFARGVEDARERAYSQMFERLDLVVRDAARWYAEAHRRQADSGDKRWAREVAAADQLIVEAVTLFHALRDSGIIRSRTLYEGTNEMSTVRLAMMSEPLVIPCGNADIDLYIRTHEANTEPQRILNLSTRQHTELVEVLRAPTDFSGIDLVTPVQQTTNRLLNLLRPLGAGQAACETEVVSNDEIDIEESLEGISFPHLGKARAELFKTARSALSVVFAEMCLALGQRYDPDGVPERLVELGAELAERAEIDMSAGRMRTTDR